MGQTQIVPSRLESWKEMYPNAKLEVHNQFGDIYEWAYAKEAYWEVCEHSFRNADGTMTDNPEELCFETQYIPLDELYLTDLLNLYGDEKSFHCLDVAGDHIPCLRLWYD